MSQLEDKILSKYTLGFNTSADPEQDTQTDSTIPKTDDITGLEDKLLSKYTTTDAAPEVGTGTVEDRLLAKYTERPERESDITGALVRGAQISVAPMSVDTEEMRKPRTAAETVAEVGANVATDIITSLGAGALAGSIVPGAGTAVGAATGAAVAIGLAVYRALGYEELMSRVDGKGYNIGRAAISAAAEINPLLKIGGRAAKFASQGALQTLQALAYGASGELAGVAGAVGGGMATLGHNKALRVAGLTAMLSNKTMGKKTVMGMADALAEPKDQIQILKIAHAKAKQGYDGDSVFMGVLERHDTNIFKSVSSFDEYKAVFAGDELFIPTKGQLRKSTTVLNKISGKDKEFVKANKEDYARFMIMEHEMADLARFVLQRPDAKISEELFTDAAKRLGASGDSAFTAYSKLKTQHYLEKAAGEVMSTDADTYGTLPKDPLSNDLFRFFNDILYTARAVDRSAGTNLEGLVNQVAFSHNKHSDFMYSIQKRTNKLLSKAKKQGLDRMEVVRYLEEGADAFTGPAEHKALLFATEEGATSFRSIFDEIHEYGTRNGLSIDYLQNYAPRIRKDLAQSITDVRREARAALAKKEMPSEEVLESLRQLTGMGEMQDSSDVYKALNLMRDAQTVKSQTGFAASAAYERSGEFPALLRERDIGKVLLSYANNTSKSIHIDPVVRELSTQLPMLKALGWEKSHKYLQDYMSGLSGKPSNFLAWQSAATTRMKVSLDEMMDGLDVSTTSGKATKSVLNAAKFAPDFIAWSLAQIYPNYLGLSLKAFSRNLAQPLFMTAPEVGGGYGYKLTAKATMETMLDMKRHGVGHLKKVLTEMGYAPGEFIGEGMNVMYNSMRQTRLGKGVEIVDAYGEFAMKLYGWSDVLNRYITTKVSKQLTKDILANKPQALRALKKMSTGVKAELSISNPDKMEEIISKYMISKTQFNYGSHSMSEYGRTFGRFASMFTKWPTMIYGDVLDAAGKGRGSISKPALEIGAKYLAPWAAVAAMSAWLGETKNDPRKRAIVGQSLLDWHPFASLQVSKPPVVEIGSQLGSGFLDAVAFDFGSAGKKALKAITPVMPGMGVLKATESNIFNFFLDKEMK